MRGIYQHFLTLARREEIKKKMKENGRYFFNNKKIILLDLGIYFIGYFEKNYEFGWILPSGTVIKFDGMIIFVSGRRRLIYDFLKDYLTEEEINNLQFRPIEGQKTSKKIGDTI